MLNKIIIQGRLTADPELRYTQAGKPVASFTMAVEGDFADQDGNRSTDFLDVVAWSKSAEFVSKHFSKGSMAIVSGRLQTRTYEDKNGNRRKVVEIRSENIYFCEKKRATNDHPHQEANPSASFDYLGPDFDAVVDPEDMPF